MNGTGVVGSAQQRRSLLWLKALQHTCQKVVCLRVLKGSQVAKTQQKLQEILFDEFYFLDNAGSHLAPFERCG